MTRPLLVLRPEPGASATVAAAQALGLSAIAAPLFVVRPLDWTTPASPPQAILMTSANAARHGGAMLAALTDLPLYAVGEATAAAARKAGFRHIVVGDEGVDAIVARARRDGVEALLHLAGREYRPSAGAGAGAIERRLVYAAEAATALPEAARAALPDAIALLHSPRAASLFASLVQPGGIGIAAISPAAREAAGDGWRIAAVAARPTDASLLAAAAKLCDQAG
jgi:uroporphyrinogen-III synthase